MENGVNSIFMRIGLSILKADGCALKFVSPSPYSITAGVKNEITVKKFLKISESVQNGIIHSLKKKSMTHKKM